MKNKAKWQRLKVGDKIRAVSVPKSDLLAYKSGSKYLRSTIQVLRRMVTSKRVLRISQIDEYGHPWVDFNFINSRGVKEYHSLMIWDDESWVPVKPKKRG